MQVFGPVQLPLMQDGLHMTISEKNYFLMSELRVNSRQRAVS